MRGAPEGLSTEPRFSRHRRPRRRKTPAMQPASRAAAKLMRACLVDDRPSPEAIRSSLNGVSSEDRDGWLDLLLDVEEILDDEPELPRGCVPYLPCPVSTVLDVIYRAKVTSRDVFVDVGAGIGRTAFLTHLVT